MLNRGVNKMISREKQLKISIGFVDYQIKKLLRKKAALEKELKAINDNNHNKLIKNPKFDDIKDMFVDDQRKGK